MQAARILFRRELLAIAYAPSSHVVAAVFIVLQGVGYLAALRPFLDSPQSRSLLENFFQGPLFWIPFLVLVPTLTMRLFAEERKMGTMEMLLTAPVRVRDVVVAKFAATFVYFCLLWVPGLLFMHLHGWLSGGPPTFEAGALLSTYGLVLAMGAMFLAVGCLASAMTTSQLAAGIMTFGVLMLLMLLAQLPPTLGQMADPVQRFFFYINSDAHLRDATAGLLDSRPFVYYLSGAAVLLGATGYALNARRWRS